MERTQVIKKIIIRSRERIVFGSFYYSKKRGENSNKIRGGEGIGEEEARDKKKVNEKKVKKIKKGIDKEGKKWYTK